MAARTIKREVREAMRAAPPGSEDTYRSLFVTLLNRYALAHIENVGGSFSWAQNNRSRQVQAASVAHWRGLSQRMQAKYKVQASFTPRRVTASALELLPPSAHRTRLLQPLP